MQEPIPETAPAPERRHLGGGAVASTVAQVAVFTVAALTSITIARALGPDGSGAYALAASLFGIALLVSGIGLKQGITVRIGSSRWSPAAATRDLVMPFVLSTLVAVLLGVGAWQLGRDGFLSGLPAAAVPVLIAAIPFGVGWQWSWSMALGRERYEAYAVLQVLPWALALVIAGTLAILTDPTGAVVGLAVAQILAGLAAVVWALRFAHRDERPPSADLEPRPRRLAEAYRIGLLTWASELLQFVNFRFDLFFLAAYASTSTVGIYSVGATATTIALILPQALAVAVLPRSAALEGASARGEGSVHAADESDARAARHTLLLLPISALIVGLVVVVGIPLFFGSRFDDAVTYGLLLLPGTLALGLGKVYSSVVTGRGQPRYLLYTVLITVPLTVVAYLLVIPDEGADGAAIVSSCSYLLTAFVTYLFFRRVTGIPVRDALVPRRDDLRAYPEVAALSINYIRSMIEAVRRRDRENRRP